MEFRVCSASRPNRHLFCAHRRHSCTTHARDSTQRLSSTQSAEKQRREREREREREKEDDAFFFFLRKKKKTTKKKKKDPRFGIEE